jgi:adenosylmethionine-8-amino-7-oxononanoate aminotransferase
LLVHDEVMSGGGRTGRFFGSEHWDGAPDIIAISKGFGAGYVPLGAIIAHQKIVDAVSDSGGFAHGFTYAGNPLACAAGLAVITEIEDQKMINNAEKMGDLLKSRLIGLTNRYPFIGDVRGKGLLLAFELVSDRTTMSPLAADLNAYNRLVDIAYLNNLIIYSRRSRGGNKGDHFLVCPPMIITETQIDEIMNNLVKSLDTFASECKLPVSTP